MPIFILKQINKTSKVNTFIMNTIEVYSALKQHPTSCSVFYQRWMNWLECEYVSVFDKKTADP